MTARERILELLDADSFHEYDLFVKHAGVDFDMDKKFLRAMGSSQVQDPLIPILFVFLRRTLLLREDL